MLTHLRPAIALTVLFTLLTGLAYPLAMTGIAHVLFPSTSATLIADVAARRAAFEAANGAPAPIDAVTTSGSGLDPHISPENARAQADRIAAVRGADPAAVRTLIEGAVQGRTLGLYGEPAVNVLLTNIALDDAFPMPPAGNP